MVIVLLIGIFFIRRLQPIVIIIVLVLIVLLYSYEIYMVMGGYWYRYLLVMVILSGVLVLFIYIIRLIPNEKFESESLLYLFIFVIFIMGFSDFLWKFNWRFVSLNLWLSYFGIINLLIVVFLFGIILGVVWLRYMEYGALRI